MSEMVIIFDWIGMSGPASPRGYPLPSSFSWWA
jgi:hypothetical protein